MLNKEPDVVFIKGVLGLGGAVFISNPTFREEEGFLKDATLLSFS